MAKYKVWDGECGNDEEDADVVEARDEQQAAELWLERHFADMSYPSSCVLDVRDRAGTHSLWEVTVESVPVFHAAKYEPPVKCGDSHNALDDAHMEYLNNAQ